MRKTGMLTHQQFIVLNCLYNTEIKGRTPIFSDQYQNTVLEKTRVMEELVDLGYIDEQFGMITAEGIGALEPYRVQRAVILAAGPSTRCIPLSLEVPKGLFEVKGEFLIERQIEQLQEAGITDITVVLGYKMEQLTYLQDKYQIRIIENHAYSTKNNIHSLYLAKDLLANAYICCCDDYFAEDLFNQFEYDTFYAGIHVDSQRNEMYVYVDEDQRIVKMQHQLDKGLILLGHSFWTKEFADRFIQLVEADMDAAEHDFAFWEWMVKDHLDDMPPIYLKRFASKAIVEFDYFDDLRRFDSGYIKNTHSKIVQNIISVFHCDESDIIDFRNISEGLTNTSFIFKINGVDYIYRHPGDGTEKIINRMNERSSLELAREWGIDPTYVYMDVTEGWKISVFIPEFREPSYADLEDSKKVIQVMKRLHSLPIKVDYGLRAWEDAVDIVNILEEKEPHCFDPYLPLKDRIEILYNATKGDGVQKCFCHADTYKPNWMIKPDGDVILIDWEYSGWSDPGIDVGYYIVDAQYDIDEAEWFIAEYLGDQMTGSNRFHFLAYTAIIAFYWFVWALYRESCGANMGDSLPNWRDMAYKYSDHLLGGERV